VAEPAYRSLSLLLLDSVVHQPAVDLYLNNSASTASLGPLDLFQCRRVPAGVWDRSAFWITHHQRFLENLFRAKGRPWATPLSYPLSAAVFLRDKIFEKAFGGGCSNKVAVCPSFDHRFDAFWSQLRRNHPGLLLAVRTREALEWHFKYALLQKRLWIAVAPNSGKLDAYAIFERKDNLKLGLKRVRLVDFQSLDGSTALLAPILAWALKACRDEGVHVLESCGRWLEAGGFLHTAAPHQRTLAVWTYFYRANDPSLAERLTDPQAWAPSLYDGDASL